MDRLDNLQESPMILMGTSMENLWFPVNNVHWSLSGQLPGWPPSQIRLVARYHVHGTGVVAISGAGQEGGHGGCSSSWKVAIVWLCLVEMSVWLWLDLSWVSWPVAIIIHPRSGFFRSLQNRLNISEYKTVEDFGTGRDPVHQFRTGRSSIFLLRCHVCKSCCMRISAVCGASI